jgi:hypothetical protein
MGDNHLDKELLNLFINILKKIAFAFPPETTAEEKIVIKFKESFTHIK